MFPPIHVRRRKAKVQTKLDAFVAAAAADDDGEPSMTFPANLNSLAMTVFPAHRRVRLGFEAPCWLSQVLQALMQLPQWVALLNE